MRIIRPKKLLLIAKNNSIHCNSCEIRIKSVLSTEPGIIDISADHQNQEIKLVYDDEKISVSKIKDMLGSIGFPID